MARRSTPKRSRSKAARKRRKTMWGIVGASLAVALLYCGWLAWQVGREFEGRRWDLPAKVYAAPLELYAGRALEARELVGELKRLGYREDPRLPGPGTYRAGPGRVEMATRGFSHAADAEPGRTMSITFAAGRIGALRDSGGATLALARLDPLLIGSLFPAHGEDRLIVEPEEIPPLLPAALKAVEDRRFDRHFGVDPIAMVRASVVNLSEGEIRQGASTITQQLVRSYFLSNERTWWRKVREAFMAVALELRYSKDDLMGAYINEIYLGQDGARAVHGFGLASQFYFGKPLGELELHELALLVTEVRGPVYYDPRRHPDRALERRNLVLHVMREEGLIAAADEAKARKHDLDLVAGTGRGTTQWAFLGLVRRQLAMDYPAEDLERKGLVVLSTFDPTAQAAAESALSNGLAALGGKAADIDGAVVVTSPHTGEVRAIVGGGRAATDGFNRALDARRQIGSLIKPALYLAAFESGRYNLASIVDDSPIDMPLENGKRWSPQDFDKGARGPVPLVRALAESLNLPAVRVGLDVGLDPIADVLVRLGLHEKPKLYPSMLLGAFPLTPIEVAQVYNTLANGGFRVPLRAVRSVIDENGKELARYPIEIAQAADAAAVYQVNQALVQVMERGTGSAVRQELPADLAVAGKTGTSDDLRDSWFAGFTNDVLVVAWLGADDNRPTGLTGATGAAKVWAGTMRSLRAASYDAPQPDSVELTWINYATGQPSAGNCSEAVSVPLPVGEKPGGTFTCDGANGLGARLRRLLKRGGQ
jgi:penicillin-binding protein 1B